jgi:hypothetical protein
MQGYVIRSNDTGKYVAYPGSKSSYTRDILNARRFATREDAKRDACGNETVINLAGM